MADVIVVGSYVQDLCFRTKDFPEPGQTLLGDFVMGQGGKGFNQAVAAHRQEISTLFVGAVGQDAFASDLREFSKTEGLELALEDCSEVGTGAAAILVNASGQNQIIVDTGASGKLSAAHVRSLSGRFETAKVVVTQAECNLEASAEALRLGHACGALTIFNPAPMNDAVQSELLQLAGIITPNESEFVFLMKHVFGESIATHFWQSDDEQIHLLCRRFEIPVVILTLGENGCFVSCSPATRFGSESPFFRVPAHKVKVLDTTGAGDAFSGGLAAGLVRTPHDLRAAVHYGSAVAALSTTALGTAPAMPHKGPVEALLC